MQVFLQTKKATFCTPIQPGEGLCFWACVQWWSFADRCRPADSGMSESPVSLPVARYLYCAEHVWTRHLERAWSRVLACVQYLHRWYFTIDCCGCRRPVIPYIFHRMDDKNIVCHFHSSQRLLECKYKTSVKDDQNGFGLADCSCYPRPLPVKEAFTSLQCKLLTQKYFAFTYVYEIHNKKGIFCIADPGRCICFSSSLRLPGG